MDSNANSRAVRVSGEVIALHCWACGTAHCVNLESCNAEELAHMVCSNTSCRMSMFLVNELLVDDRTRRTMNSELADHLNVLSRFWK